MQRDLQFGMRENPASDRRHGSRLAIPVHVNETCIEQNLASPPHLTNGAPSTVAVADVLQAASPHAATGRRKPNESRLLTVPEVAALLQVTVSWVYGRTRSRSRERLPGYRLGKYWRFREDEVHAWIERQCGEPRNA